MDSGAIVVGEPHEVRKRVMAIVGASSGNLVEWYDFYTYAFTALYFAHAFFPSGNQTVALLQAAAVFAIGFLMRPIGGWLFGRLGDRKGRKFSMLVSVLMMCGGSLLIAILPTYETIGIAAPLLLLLARMTQGLSVGGEYGTVATYMSEVATSKNRGFYSSFQYVTLIGGQLLAVLVVVILEFLITADEMRAWGWRIPFLIGAATAVIALYLRRSLHETSTEKTRNAKGAGTLRALLDHPRSFLTVLGLTAGGSLPFYTFTTYMQKYLVNTTGFPVKTVSLVMTAALFLYMCMQPIFGAISDRFGRKNLLLVYGVAGILTTIPLLNALGTASSPAVALGLLLIALAIISCYTSISGVLKAELFPAEVRALGVGLSYAIGNAVFGGSAEYVALSFKNAGVESYFAWYVTFMLVVALISVILMPDMQKKGFMRDEHSR
ncbi:MFS family transporter [Roseomonas gilardii subsp. gilardii]|uniref:MFS family transporter n=1 Tax=Roseomonas gilardii TaxID=257708 RepID=UPI001FF91F25|nr:MFS family transporter [Roseomonas gilardii]UPG73938.1 MFS family transporter [Roseomonas gilardii subsp. gilardii]